jgi:hypothetical protein
MNAFPCPLCKKAFCRTGWKDVPLPSSCMNCGLPKWTPLQTKDGECSGTEHCLPQIKPGLAHWVLRLGMLTVAAGGVLHFLSYISSLSIPVRFLAPLYIGCFVSLGIAFWIARVPLSTMQIFTHIPLPMYVLIVLIAVYLGFVWNHAMREGLQRGNPEERGGKFVLVDGGRVIGELKREEYLLLLALELRFYSGLSLLFALVGCVIIRSNSRLGNQVACHSSSNSTPFSCSRPPAQ